MLAWYRIWPFLGRVCLAGIFLQSGLSKFMHWPQTTAYMTAKAIPFPEFLLPLAAGVEIVAALLLIIGFKIRWAALALILYLIPTTLLFHAFWTAEGPAVRGEMIQFLKNLAIIGGLLHVASPTGPQPLFSRN